mmetsp:Transcript_37069/g.88968  ORF Transcript_37069/g.88968 Transcript_37069/m.88968 type:complete len:240 (+) Transcript_37069:425-1144(+)
MAPPCTSRGRTWPWPPERFCSSSSAATSRRSAMAPLAASAAGVVPAASTESSCGSAAASKTAETKSVVAGSSRGMSADMSWCDMMASARTAAVLVGSAGAWSSCRMGCSAPSATMASRKSAADERLPSTAAAAACVSSVAAERSEMSDRCQPEARKTFASLASTPRLATACTAHCCTASSSCSNRPAMRGSAPASRSASRFGSEWESEVMARAACVTTVASPLPSMATSGWMVMRSMSE